MPQAYSRGKRTGQVVAHLARSESHLLNQGETLSNHTTQAYDENTLTDAQLAGRACVVCGAESGPMAIVSLYVHEGGETDWVACSDDEPEARQLATAVQRLQQNLNTITPEQADLPEAWERDAKKAGDQAAMSVRFEYRLRMAALDKGRDSDAPAYWLASHPCPTWCAYPESHRSGDDPDDRAHDSDPFSVSFDSMEPSVAYAEFRAPEMRFMLTSRFREVEPRVYLEMEGEPVGHATLDEAEQIAFHLLDLVRQARGHESPKILPYDSHGQCVTRDCATCRIDQASA